MRDPEPDRGLIDWLLACPEKGFFVPMASELSLQFSPRELESELRLAAAMHWYSRGKISQEHAAQLAGMDRTDFLLAVARVELHVDGEHAYTDYLGLYRTWDGWKIVNKHFQSHG